MERGEPVATHCVEGHTDEIWTVAIPPDGEWLATGSDDGTTRLWKIRQLPTSGALPPAERAVGEEDIVAGSTILFQHDNQEVRPLYGAWESQLFGLDVGTQYSQVRMWRVEGGQPVPLPLAAPSGAGPNRGNQLVGKGRWLVRTIASPDEVRPTAMNQQLWLCDLSAATGETTRWHRLDAPLVQYPRFMSDRWLGTTCADGVRLFDLTAADPLNACLFVRYATPLRRGGTAGMYISRDENWLITGQELFDLRQWTGQSMEIVLVGGRSHPGGRPQRGRSVGAARKAALGFLPGGPPRSTT